MSKKRRNQIIVLIFVFLLAAAIFMFSAQNGEKSSDFSGYFTEKFLRIFHIENVSFGRVEHFLRKAAHFIEFFLLGMVSCLWISGFRKHLFVTGVISFVPVFLYAVLDEMHQYFIPGRSASWKDVLLDGTGALCGVLTILLCRFFYGLYRNRKNKVNMLYGNEKELDKTDEKD
ncbi:MAG: VanZ family protein [Clostridia bacterium]|nr:VanZ family protein [Clostridia bacterium]